MVSTRRHLAAKSTPEAPSVALNHPSVVAATSGPANEPIKAQLEKFPSLVELHHESSPFLDEDGGDAELDSFRGRPQLNAFLSDLQQQVRTEKKQV